MKVTKEMLRKELQPGYWMMKLSSWLLMNRVGVALLNSNSARSKGKNIDGIHAAPARAKDYSKLPPAITFVGDLEPFRDETISYVGNMERAGVPVTFKLFEGCYHAFDVLFPDLEVSMEAWSFLLDAYKSYTLKYICNDGK